MIIWITVLGMPMARNWGVICTRSLELEKNKLENTNTIGIRVTENLIFLYLENYST